MYQLLRKQFDGCHVIEFPDYVLGDSRHRFGACGLHYHALYEQYGKNAIKIICEGHSDEKLLLDFLRDKYSLKFQLLRNEIENKYRFNIIEAKIENLVRFASQEGRVSKLKGIFQGITNIDVYLETVNLYKQDIGVLISVRDTPGCARSTNCFESIKDLGFKRYPSKLWYTYCGFILKGVVVADIASDIAENHTIWNGVSYSHSICLESHSWRKLNTSKILIDNVNYSPNGRGANIVIINAETFEVLDTVTYDMHEAQDCFRRIKKI